jgi:trehalose 6-phosphate synthase
VRPLFRKEDWLAYRKVNGEFAKSLLAEIRNVEQPLILVQDYHLALLPALIKSSRPDAQVAIFWHIPWPSAESFSICPWRKEILQGMLGSDLVGFHTQQYCNNFLSTVGSELESLNDLERFSVSYSGHKTFVKPFPISIAFPGLAEPKKPTEGSVLNRLGIQTKQLVLGVDRLDYTKGILERLKGVEFFFDKHPEFKERVTFLQIASPTREDVEKYREYSDQVTAEAERINNRIGTRTWQPIILEKRTYSHAELRELYELAQVCLVTSLHDGMNLVAKEYVAARTKEDGVLVLSMFTGASRDMRGAVMINPYSAEETADAMYAGLTMPKTEQHRRMKTMRDSVKDYNVYRWAAEFIKALASIT